MSKKNSFFQSKNPTAAAFRNSNRTAILDDALVGQGGNVMTIAGAVNKTLLLTGILLLTAALGVYVAMTTAYGQTLMMTGAIGGLIVALVTFFKPEYAPTTAPLYAALEGLFLGTISLVYGVAFGGMIVIQAIGLTMCTLLAMLLLYKTGMIKVTQKFRMIVGAATGAIMLMYVISFICSMLGMPIGFLHSGGALGIGISLVVIGVAALNLVLDFDLIEQGANMQAPKYMEWYAGFSLLVTLVWLYLEFLRLLSYFAGE